MKRILILTLVAFSLSSCVSNRVFNDLESRYAQLKDNYNRQTKSIETLQMELEELKELFRAKVETLSETQDSLRAKKQSLEKLESSIELLKQNSESALKARIAENEVLMEKIADRENELADRMNLSLIHI